MIFRSAIISFFLLLVTVSHISASDESGKGKLLAKVSCTNLYGTYWIGDSLKGKNMELPSSNFEFYENCGVVCDDGGCGSLCAGDGIIKRKIEDFRDIGSTDQGSVIVSSYQYNGEYMQDSSEVEFHSATGEIRAIWQAEPSGGMRAQKFETTGICRVTN